MNSRSFIYGAGIVASSIYTAMKALYHFSPAAFLVSDSAGNPARIDGVPVRLLSDIADFGLADRIYIATPEEHHGTIVSMLAERGIAQEQIVLADNQFENHLLEEYYRSLPGFTTAAELLAGDHGENIAKLQDIQVFQAKCHVDKPLKKETPIPAYVLPIQVGAVFADQRIARLQDNTGENISEKNRNYCELTAGYYAWKNSKAAYKGLCHYRRIFDLDERQMEALLERRQEWDVVIPYPSVQYPDISAQHGRYLKEADWQAMLEALRQTAPEYLEAYEQAVNKGERYFLNFNMLIARAEVFDEYCEFLFRVLGRAEELVFPRGWERADRFAGYMGENLTTIYFLANRDRLKIVCSGKLWLT